MYACVWWYMHTHMLVIKELYTWLQIYSKPSLFQLQLIQMLDNPYRNMRNKENAVDSWVHALKETWHLGRQMSHLSIQTKLEGFFKPALLRSKTSTTSESPIVQ
jgi:hypothetical protein